MSLDLPQLLPQLENAGQAVSERAQRLAEALPQAQAALQAAAALSPKALESKIQRAGERWSGAIPSGEPLTHTYASPPQPQGLHVLGADGSQIYPDRHASALYFLINVGSIHLHTGSHEPPRIASRPTLFYEEEDLYADERGLISAALVNGRRDAAEMGELARLAETCSPEPTLALMDNGLLLWLLLQVRDHSRQSIDRILKEYLQHMDRLRGVGAALAGIIDRPRHSNVIDLVHLASLPDARIKAEALSPNPFRGLTDALLFGRLLSPGHRSPVFIHGSPVNDQFRARGHEVLFFYMRPETGEQAMRVEVPRWVAEQSDFMRLVHAGILEQCRSTGGFPYVLIRAHELALVSASERDSLEHLLGQNLLRRGLQARRSRKSLTKRWTGSRKRHLL